MQYMDTSQESIRTIISGNIGKPVPVRQWNRDISKKKKAIEERMDRYKKMLADAEIDLSALMASEVRTKKSSTATLERNDEMIKLFASGWTYTELKRKYGLSITTVNSIIKGEARRIWDASDAGAAWRANIRRQAASWAQ